MPHERSQSQRTFRWPSTFGKWEFIAAVRFNMRTARQRIRVPPAAKLGAVLMPAEWHLVNQLAHPLVELRRFDDVDDSEVPIPREY